MNELIASCGDSNQILKNELLKIHQLLSIPSSGYSESGFRQGYNNGNINSSLTAFTEKGMFSYTSKQKQQLLKNNSGLGTINHYSARQQQKNLSDTFISKFINAPK